MPVAAQTDDDTATVKKNEFSIDFQFMGRGESRYGGMVVDESDPFDNEAEDPKPGKSNFLLSRMSFKVVGVLIVMTYNRCIGNSLKKFVAKLFSK